MDLKLLPSKWLNKRTGVEQPRDERDEHQEEHPVYFLQSEMNRLFDDFFRAGENSMFGPALGLSPFHSLQQSTTRPRIDIQETEKELRISAELPGLTEKDIDVSLSREILTISGEKKQESEQTVKGWYCMERSYGKFTRSISLPCEVDQDSCNASFKNGVLTISLTKSPQAQATIRSIPIRKN